MSHRICSYIVLLVILLIVIRPFVNTQSRRITCDDNSLKLQHCLFGEFYAIKRENSFFACYLLLTVINLMDEKRDEYIMSCVCDARGNIGKSGRQWSVYTTWICVFLFVLPKINIFSLSKYSKFAINIARENFSLPDRSIYRYPAIN